MSDEEIKKALECCADKDGASCKNCPYNSDCSKGGIRMLTDSLALINRQQAEIDDLKRDTVPKLQDSLNRANKYGRATDRENARLKADIERLQGAVQEWVDGKCLSQKHLLMIGKLQNEIEQAKSEAIKEFAERLRKEAVTKCDWDNCVDVEDIDRLVAEMVGEQNA